MESLTAFKSIFLGVVQGLAEFLPVSSSAHLVIFQQWLGLSKEGTFLLAYDVLLHFGTLMALLVVFKKELVDICRSFIKPTEENQLDRKLGLFIILATIPAGVIGVKFEDFFSVLFADAIPASFFLIITGWILWLTKFVQVSKIDIQEMRWYHAVLVGLAQAVAILPGISRSGSTIAMGLFIKLSPAMAVRFSFLLAIPAILGANIFEARHIAAIKPSAIFPVFLGILAAFVVGYVAIRWMLRLVADSKLHVFSWYCWIFGGFTLLKELFF